MINDNWFSRHPRTTLLLLALLFIASGYGGP
jgi:hypothetical protein